uniref:Uncharacterized protein n=1 Tax=Lactuca sativa TaxID=4236 RepID=A0A9R1XKG1_LACSA|nr:hypothetical protein LSAT_V11C400186390 [Lactuca sativa]
MAFHVGQKYKSKKELKDKVDMHALEAIRNIPFKKNDMYRLTDVCVMTYTHKHTCLHTRKIRSCTTTFLSKKFVDQIKTNIEVPVRALQDQIQKQYRKTNEGQLIKIEVVSKPIYASPHGEFKKDICKDSKVGLRDFLGLDGAFMKNLALNAHWVRRLDVLILESWHFHLENL